MKRVATALLTLVVTGIVLIYAAGEPFDGPPRSTTKAGRPSCDTWAPPAAEPACESPLTIPRAFPESDRVPTLAPPEPADEPSADLAVIDLPPAEQGEMHMILVPVEVQRVAAGRHSGEDR